MNTPVRFNKNLAKKIEQTTLSDMGPADSQGFEQKSPGKMHWFTVKGESYDELMKVDVTQLYDPDGSLENYLIQVEDKSLREKSLTNAMTMLQLELGPLCKLVWYRIFVDAINQSCRKF